jgi:hypothetical protein
MLIRKARAHLGVKRSKINSRMPQHKDAEMRLKEVQSTFQLAEYMCTRLSNSTRAIFVVTARRRYSHLETEKLIAKPGNKSENRRMRELK